MSALTPPGITPIANEDLIPKDWEAYLDIYMRLSAGTLFHYTSQSGLLAILDQKRLRATDIRFLNDAQEFEHASTVALAAISDLAETLDADERDFLSALPLVNVHALGTVPTAFIFSLTELADDLSQWRAYCPAGGFAIGFEIRRLVTAGARHGFRLSRCIYDEAEQLEAMKRLLDEAILRFRTPAERATAQTRFADDFLRLAPLLKHPSFKAEREWRLVSTPERYSEPAQVGIKLREGRTMPVPYVELPLSLDHLDVTALEKQLTPSYVLWPIPELWIGPSANPELAFISASVAILREFPIHDILRIRHSEIPYRNWL